MFITITRICFILEVLSLVCIIIEKKFNLTIILGDLFIFIWIIEAINVFLNFPGIVYIFLSGGVDISGYRPPLYLIPMAICDVLLIFVYIVIDNLKLKVINIEAEHTKNKKIPYQMVIALELLVCALSLKILSYLLLLFSRRIPKSLYEFILFTISIMLMLFLFISAYYLKPHGFIILSVAAAILCMGVYLLIWIIGISITSIILALLLFCVIFLVLTYSSGIFSLFIMGDIVAVSNLAFLIPLIAVPSVVTTAAGSMVVKDGIETAVSRTKYKTKIDNLFSKTINFFLLFLVSIPLLSATTGLSGLFRCKPAYIAGLKFLHRNNLIFSDNSVDSVNIWGSDKEYYVDMDIFENGNRNCLQNTEQYNSYADDDNFVILHGGVLQIIDIKKKEIVACEACPIKNGADTVIFYTGSEALVLGKEELYILNNDNKHYMRLYYPWCENYLNMSNEEQMDLIYDILSNNINTTKRKNSPLNLAALVKLSAQRGQLVHYDIDNNIVIFASPNKDGSITFFRQTSPEKRVAFATVTTHSKCARVPYMYDSNNGQIICINDSQVFIINSDGRQSDNLGKFEEGDFISWNLLNTDTGDHFVFLQKENELYTYSYKNKSWVVQDVKLPTEKGGTGILLRCKTYYEWYYADNDLIRKFTYIKDAFDDYKTPLWKRFICNNYHFLRYIEQPLDDDFGANQDN